MIVFSFLTVADWLAPTNQNLKRASVMSTVHFLGIFKLRHIFNIAIFYGTKNIRKFFFYFTLPLEAVYTYICS